MGKRVFILVLMLFFSEINAQREIRYLELKKEFVPNQMVYLFGDNVKLRKEPTTESIALKKLKITSELQIIRKTNETYLYNGIKWPWYEVRYKNTKGYIIGGFISLDTKKILTSTYVITYKKEEDNYKIIVRVINESGNYIENSQNFGTESTFSLEVFDNRGIPNIKDMVYVNYHAEACGINGGGYYLFNDGNFLTKAISLSEVGDGGIYWFSEEVVFPNEKGGKEGKILYRKEAGELVDEITNRTKTTIETCEFVWEGKLLELKKIED